MGGAALRTCVVCGSTNNRAVFNEFGVDMMRCRSCGHVFSSWTANQDYEGYFDAASVASADQFYWDQAHDRIYTDFCDRFIAGRSGRILDVGCGLGYFVKRVAGFPGWHAVGYEISPTAVAFAQTTLGLTDVHCGRVEDSGFAPGSFDLITLWDVIEHIPEPDPLLSYLCGLLAEGGMLCMHTPNATIQVPKAKLTRMLRGMDPSAHYLEARDHMNLYTMSTLTRVLRRCGYRDVRYIHLPPIQSVAGSRNGALRAVKNAWASFATLLFHATFHTINLDNLFVIARPGGPPTSPPLPRG